MVHRRETQNPEKVVDLAVRFTFATLLVIEQIACFRLWWCLKAQNPMAHNNVPLIHLLSGTVYALYLEGYLKSLYFITLPLAFRTSGVSPISRPPYSHPSVLNPWFEWINLPLL